MSESWGGSGGGWGNPVVGSTALRIPAINSPNFNLANPSASPSPSWAILQNGLAYFFGLVLSGGTIMGPDYIINTSGIFIYSGAPANGNLIGSWAGAAGTDAFGNTYPQGFNISKGAISGTVFSGSNFTINPSGMFVYTGTPAAGNLLIAIAGAAGNDGLGNSWQAGLTVFGPSGAQIILEDNGSQAALLLIPASTTHISVNPQLITGAINPGAVNELLELTITSGKESGHDDAALQLFSESADATVAAVAVIEFGGQAVVFVTRNGVAANHPGTSNTPETWQTITLDTGWSTVAGMPAPQYRMLASGEIEFSGAASHASFAVNQNLNGSNPIAAAYRPTNNHVWRTGNGGTVADSEFLTTGVIQGLGQASGSVRMYLDGVCPLI